ncbi:hypothetical protein [Candidatus Albibeggiatoa sp. nov. BB20]|uniref:hypothetical protein n=1 Tax=Candidatus Albibeggiatoa sp. nov. BB20 TaxID=3162723 RepID=UPI003365365A
MIVRFSEHPGCWERHLQRQYKNPLFAHLEYDISQMDVEDAQRRDEKERQIFQTDFQHLLEEVANLQSQVEAEIVLKLKDRIDALYEQCAGLGGDFSQAKKGLRNLNELIMQAILSSGVESDDLLERLDHEKAARQMHFSLLEYPFIAHLLHPNSPIGETDIVPSLLTEGDASLRAAMSLFETKQQKILCEEGRNLLTRLKELGYDLPTAWMRLASMEQPLYKAS